MNKMKKISVIVPTYNVEAYIAKCLDSLLFQDYENYDVIVVNDGSPFNEQAIIDKYTLTIRKSLNVFKKRMAVMEVLLKLVLI